MIVVNANFMKSGPITVIKFMKLSTTEILKLNEINSNVSIPNQSKSIILDRVTERVD